MTAARAERAAWAVCGMGLLGCIAGWIVSPAAFGAAWLSALFILMAWSVGSIGLVFVHALTGGRWGVLARAPLMVGTATTPLLLPAVVPILLLVGPVYGWAQPHVAKTLANTRYLNAPFFWGRLGGTVLLWIVLALIAALLARLGGPRRWVGWVAGPALALLLLTVTIVSVDTVLSREPHFNSTAFGMVIAADWALFALAIATLWAAATALGPSDGLDELGRLLLGLLILWGYLAFVQFLIVWNSDLGADAPWYVHRAAGGWTFVSYFTAVVHFAIPLIILISRRLRRSRQGVMLAGGAIVISEIPRAWWLVLPSSGQSVGWIAVLSMLGMLALCTALCLRLPPLLRRMIPSSAEALHA